MARERSEDRAESARALLLDVGADKLGLRPWQHPREGPDASTLVRFALWRASGQVGPTAELEAGLSLLESAYADLDALETALVFTARAEGLTWARIAEVMGLRSPQAAQQRYQRSTERARSSGRAHSSRGGDDA